MLRKEQQVILSLLEEIDEICQKEKIDYYLSPRLTLCAVTGQPFPQNPLFGVVLMKVGEMERFRLAAEERLTTGRALESMKTHKWFPGFYLRYENTETLCINLDAGRDYEFPGLGINILPLRTEISTGKIRRQNTMEESGWLQLMDSYSGEPGAKAFLSKTAIWLRSLLGQERLGAKLYDNFCIRQQNPDADAYILKRRKLTTVFPAVIFSRTKRVTLEGKSFQVPFDTEGYLKAGYGPDYLKETEPPYVQATQMVVSARVSYEQFRQEAEGLDKLVLERIRKGRKQARARKRKEYFNECWEYACFCGARMNMGVTYKKKRDYIRNLYKNEDYLTLEKVFKPYSKMMQKCLLKEEVFMEDEEIFEIYMDVLEKTGKAVQKSKISALI